MGKRVFYTYNPATDDFERYYPGLKERLSRFGLTFGLGVAIGIGIYLVSFYLLDSPTERNLREENAQLRERYSVLERRLGNSLEVLEDIRNRDENFYRVMMQMEPANEKRMVSGLDKTDNFKNLRNLTDAALVEEVSREMNLLEKAIYAQSLSFDELREGALSQKQRLAHIPQIIPVNIRNFSIASGFGYRRDPIYGTTKFHKGIDITAPTGTPVYATADGSVASADKDPNMGNKVSIDHGFNYQTTYSHLSQILVEEGQKVKRGILIGRVGSSGKSTGPHLHYEVLFKGEPQNPVNYYFLDIGPEEYEKMMRRADNAGYVMD